MSAIPISAKTRTTILRVGILVALVLLTVYLISIRDRLQGLERYGYPGIFLVSILANATVIVPLPGILLTSAAAMVFNPFWVAVAAGSGAALGEISGYLAGFSGQGVVENVRYYEKLSGFMARHGDITIALLAFIPNPAFDMAGIMAGSLKMPLHEFLFFCWVGKLAKMLVFAYTGSSLFGLFS